MESRRTGTVGNSLGRVPLGGSEAEAWTPWTGGPPGNSLGRAWESSAGRERDGSVDTVLYGRSETEAWTPWTDGKDRLGGSGTEVLISWADRKPWEIAWGELRGQGPRRKRGHRGRTGNRGKWFGESSVGRRGRKRGHRGRMGNCETAWGELRWRERDGCVMKQLGKTPEEATY